MIQLYNSILSNIEIDEIYNYQEIIDAKINIDNKLNGYISFHISLTNKMKTILQEKMGLNLDGINRIPMRWIKGDSLPHIDNGTHRFEQTNLVYLTDSDGKFVIDNISYPIQKGLGYVFNEGLRHETTGTGLTPRLLIGPMSETGLAVGGGYNISQPGGTTVYLKQELDNGVYKLYYNTSTNSNWIYTQFPIGINNTDTSKGNLILEFITNIIVTQSNNYLFCNSNSIQFGSTSLKSDGSRPKIIINVNYYDGFYYEW